MKAIEDTLDQIQGELDKVTKDDPFYHAFSISFFSTYLFGPPPLSPFLLFSKWFPLNLFGTEFGIQCIMT